MTKEELYNAPSRHTLDLFFEANIVIPKGKNRHSHADIYHAFAEGVPTQYSSDNVNWYDMDTSASCFRRIKPNEPVYEWQWCVIMDDSTASIYGYHTEDDINKLFNKRNKFRINDTKRVRQ